MSGNELMRINNSLATTPTVTTDPDKPKIILLKDRRPDACFKDQIYDPDSGDGPLVDGDGRVVPNVGALVTDRNDGNKLYVVRAVDEYTLKSTLEPVTIIVKDPSDEIVRIISYGNERYCLYYDDRTKPTKLFVDSKLNLLGSFLMEYRLVKTNSKGQEEIFSLYVNSDDTYEGNRIPMANINDACLSGVKQCTNCHTLHSMVDNDQVECQIFDNLGILRATVILFTKRSYLQNDLSSNTQVIVNLDATSTQMDGTNFYIGQRQDISHLCISPRLEYADGTFEEITIDNIRCFMYGHENFIPTYPGQKQKLLLKYFLGVRQVSENSINTRGERYLVCEKWVTVIKNESIDGIKVSLVPIYNSVTEKYFIRYIAYSDRRDKVNDVTNYVTSLTTFNGNKYNVWQQVKFDVDLKTLFDVSTAIPYRQNSWVYLNKPTEFQQYLLSDTEDLTVVYGVEASDRRRPIIEYDAVLKQYFIPTTRFLNKEAFLDAFYYKSNPMYDPNTEMGPVLPTHFTVRALDTMSTLITAPIEVEQYGQAWNINREKENLLVNSTVIVEFLLYSGGTYQILYGAPVKCFLSKTGYNTETNNIF